jgi:hypothetical protein
VNDAPETPRKGTQVLAVRCYIARFRLLTTFPSFGKITLLDIADAGSKESHPESGFLESLVGPNDQYQQYDEVCQRANEQA